MVQGEQAKPDRSIRSGAARWAGPLKMLLLLFVTAMIGGPAAGCQLPARKPSVPMANWNQPTDEAVREAARADARGPRKPGALEIAFSFHLAESAIGASAAVYDAQGTMVRTLWSARPYGAGDHYELWDGKDDYGRQAPTGQYIIKVLSGNVHYDWDGVIGVTESSLAGPHNWDASGSFPTSLAFLNGKAFVGGGYNEGKPEAFVFDEKDPYTVAPMNLALMTGGMFEYAATDGEHIYFAALHYCCGGSEAVVAFKPDGQPYNFPQGTVIPPVGRQPAYFVNAQVKPALLLRDVRGLDVNSYLNETITGLAVERTGKLLATAHGAHGGGHLTASQDRIKLWDKKTAEPLGTVEGIHSPQKMAFDREGNLWVIEGGPVVDWYWDRGARLAKITGVGGKNEITEPIQGLDNPVDVAVNPVNGHLFIADGGSSQQVKEFDPASGKLLSTVGRPGGYGQGDACNATVTPTTLWLDFNYRGTGHTQPWIALDEAGDLWVGDFTANRMLQFHQGKYVRQIAMGRWLYSLAVPRNNPTRVFAGITGMLEYKVDYKVPLLPGDPSAPGGNGAWRLVRNWYPCFLQTTAGQQGGYAARLGSVETLTNGQTYGSVGYHKGPFDGKNTLVMLPESGKLSFVHNRFSGKGRPWLDPQGNYYKAVQTGPDAGAAITLRRYALTGYDAQGFPHWDDGAAIGSLVPDLSSGKPAPWCRNENCDWMPTAGGVIPIYAGPSWNKTVAAATPAFHLGGMPLNGSALRWQAMPEKPLLYPDGRGTYTNNSRGSLGYEAHAIDRDIFAGVSGNWQQFSCQFYHYREDGLLVGQFGWRGSDQYSHPDLGYPNPWAGEPLAPGFCGNPGTFKIVQVGKDYYLYNPDEGYRAGIHRWHIWNLDSVHEITADAPLGATVRLTKSD